MSPLVLRQMQDSALNHGPAINNIAWVLLVISALFVLTRVVAKWAISKKFEFEEVLIIMSLTFAIAQTISVNIEVSNGFGQPLSALSDSQIVLLQKYLYASKIFSIASQTLSKLSIVFLIRHISPVVLHERLALAFGCLTIVWCFTSTLVLLFQWHLPQPWKIIANECMDLKAAWNYINAANIFLEAGLLVLTLLIIWGVNVQIKRKIVIVGVFWSRILVIAAIVWQAIRFNFSDTPAGPTYMNWLTTIAIVLVEKLSIITACVPYLKPFLESLESGLIRNDDLRCRGEITGEGGFATYGSGKRSQLSMKDNEAPVQDTTAVELNQIGKGPSARTVASVTVGARSSGDSQGSRVKMITQTKTWVVDDMAAKGSSQNP